MSKSLRILHHLPPKNFYVGGFAEVTYCTICKTLALYRDMPTGWPCPICGNAYRSRPSFYAKWVPIRVQKLWWNPKSWFAKEGGYWDLSIKSIMERIPDEEDELDKSLWGGTYQNGTQT